MVVFSTNVVLKFSVFTPWSLKCIVVAEIQVLLLMNLHLRSSTILVQMTYSWMRACYNFLWLDVRKWPNDKNCYVASLRMGLKKKLLSRLFFHVTYYLLHTIRSLWNTNENLGLCPVDWEAYLTVHIQTSYTQNASKVLQAGVCGSLVEIFTQLKNLLHHVVVFCELQTE